MKIYNQPITHVVNIAVNQSICIVSYGSTVDLITPSEFGDGDSAQ